MGIGGDAENTKNICLPQENILGYGTPGQQLSATLRMSYCDDVEGVRTVDLSRGMDESDRFNFSSQPNKVNIIAAIGTTSKFDSQSDMEQATKTIMTFQ